MKIRVHAVDNVSVTREFESFVIDTQRYPELRPEVRALIQADRENASPRQMRALCEDIRDKMEDLDTEGPFGLRSVWEEFAPFENVANEDYGDQVSHLVLEKILDGDEDPTVPLFKVDEDW
tara:strand:- start:486 stop:848 length:363 start_codon:yes stop_codon:yes gene_type:complete